MYAAYYRHVVKAEKTRRARDQLHLRRPGQSRAADHRRPIATVLPKHWWEGTDSQGRKRDISATTLETAAGLGTLPDQGIRRRAFARRWSGCKDYWGDKIPTSMSARTISTNCAMSFSATIPVALEAFKADQADWIAENSRQAMGHGYDFPAVTEKRVIKEEFPIHNFGRMQAFAFNLRRDAVQGRPAAPRLQLRLRFRGDEQAAVLRPIQARSTAISTEPSSRPRACRRARSCRCSKPCATRCRPRSSPRPTQIRSAAIQKPCAQSARGRAAVEGSRLRNTRPQAGRPPPASRSPSRFLARIQRDERIVAVLQAVAGAAWRDDLRFAPSTTRSIKTGCAVSISTSIIEQCGRSRCRPATSSANSGARRPPINAGSRNAVGIKNPAVDALIEQA